MSTQAIRRSVVPIVLAALVLTVPVSAAKRRAVAHRPRPDKVAGSVKGKVTDAVTGLPVISAKVEAGRSDTTDATGNYVINAASGYGAIDVEVSRSGYAAFTAKLAAGDHTLNVQLQPTATALIRTTGGAQVNVDLDSLKFGYSSGFSRLEAPFEDFCNLDGTSVRHDRMEMKRIVGPATYVNNAACCDQQQTMKISIELKGKPAADFLFADSCSTTNPISISARNHVTGEVLYFPLTEVAEVVFP